MQEKLDTIAVEEKHTPPFFKKIPLSIERGRGVEVWDENGRRYLDFTSGWGVTCLGHAHPVITEAIASQAGMILQNPNSGLTYSPARARLLRLMAGILPAGLTRIFFASSGAEANDAAIKLARKVTRRTEVISTLQSFHGRTISTASATGQTKHREKYNPLMPSYRFVPYGDVQALSQALDGEVAAMILEPVQGEGGIHVPPERYLEQVSELCRENGSLLIVDEVQTGFHRTGPVFVTSESAARVDFLTMAKGIAGGFPFGAFAMTEEVAAHIELGDHGGTYCGNPLGCAVAHAVIGHLLEQDIRKNVEALGARITAALRKLRERHPTLLRGVRGLGLLLAVEVVDAATAEKVFREALDRGLILNRTQGNVLRVFPALNITAGEADEGLGLLADSLEAVAGAGI